MLKPGYRPEIGLGSYPEVSLASAREKRDIANAAVDRGEDPRLPFNPERNLLGCARMIDSYNRTLDRKRAAWKSSKTAFKYEWTRDHYAQNLMNRPANEITV